MTTRAAIASSVAAVALVVSANAKSFSVTLRLLDDEGKPVPGAKAIVSYELAPLPTEEVRIESDRGVSDAEGLVRLQGKTDIPAFSYGAEKEGYYIVQGMRYHFTGAKWLHWEPQNPTIDVLLKRIKNPVPMFAKRLNTRLPKLDSPVGYDLEVGDWVAPLGKGKTSDFVFVGKLRSAGDRDFDWDLAVTFSNPGDGIQRFSPDPYPATFRSPYEAPEDGYLPEWKRRRWRRPDGPDQTTFEAKGGYFFRVRTELAHDGKVVKALYGKIYGDFFTMIFYLNPDGTRNLEYDSRRNLLKYPDNWVRPDYEVGP